MRKIYLLLSLFLAAIVNSYAVVTVDSLANYEPGSGLPNRTYSETASDTSVVANPISDATNSSLKVLQFTRSTQYNSTIGLNNFDGNSTPISLFQFPILKLKALSATTTGKTITVLVNDINGYSTQIDQTMPASANTWADISFDFTSALSSTPVSFISSITIRINSGDGSTGEVYYLDDILFTGPTVSTITESTVLTSLKETFGDNAWFGAMGSDPEGFGTGADDDLISNLKGAAWGGSVFTGTPHYVDADSLKFVRTDWSGHAVAELYPVTTRATHSYVSMNNFSIAGSGNLTFSYDLYWDEAPTTIATDAVTLEYQINGGSWTAATLTSGTLPSAIKTWATAITYLLPDSVSGKNINFKLINNTTARCWVDNLIFTSTKVFATGISMSAPRFVVSPGSKLQLSDKVTPSNANQAAYWYIAAGDSAASIDASTGLLTGKKRGVATVKAIALDITGGAYTTKTVSVFKVDSVINITPKNDTVKTHNGKLQLTATVLPADADSINVIWSVVKGSATISPTGLLSPSLNGKVIVKALSKDGSNVYGLDTITYTGQVFVNNLTVKAKGDSTKISTNGGILPVFATVKPDTADINAVAWSIVKGTGNATIVAYPDSAHVKAGKNGTIWVKATATDGTGIKDSILLTLSNQQPVTNVAITSTVNSIDKNKDSILITAKATPSNAADTTILFKITSANGVHNDSIATIKAINAASAKVYGVRNGSVTIVAYSVSNEDKTASLVVGLSNQITKLDSIKIDTTVTSITQQDGTLQLKVNFFPSDASDKALTWSMNKKDSVYASLSATGLVTATKNGSFNIYVVSHDGGYKDSVTVTITNNYPWTTFPIANVLDGKGLPTNFKSNMKVRWDAKNLYANFFVSDDSIVTAGGNIWEVDNIEVYIDITNGKLADEPRSGGGWPPSYQSVAGYYQERVVPTMAYDSSALGNHIKGVKQVYTRSEGSYTIDLVYPWDSIKSGFSAKTGVKIGFDANVSENTGNPFYRSQVSWNSPFGSLYRDAATWGTLAMAADGTFTHVLDKTAPTAVTNLKGTAAASKVTLTWTPATDNIVVQEYIITQGTTVIDTLLADTTKSKNTYTTAKLADGTYTFGVVAVDLYGNVSTKVTVDVTVTSVGINFLVSNTFSTFPNPSSDKVTFTGIENNAAIVSVYDITGNLVILKSLTNGTLDVSSLNSGIYMIKVNGYNGVSKLIKR